VHDWPYWRQDLRAAIRWGLFKRVPTAPRAWTFKTVMQRSNAWGFRLRFTKPPAVLETFGRSGRRLRATGRGRVRVRAPNGCAFTAKLPFNRRICAPRRRSGR
jgi:hypothetical protein